MLRLCIYYFCWSYCFCIVRFGLTLGVSTLQILYSLHYIVPCDSKWVTVALHSAFWISTEVVYLNAVLVGTKFNDTWSADNDNGRRDKSAVDWKCAVRCYQLQMCLIWRSRSYRHRLISFVVWGACASVCALEGRVRQCARWRGVCVSVCARGACASVCAGGGGGGGGVSVHQCVR